jgi:serine/threonine-protein kinase ULK/ATG1
MKSMLVKDSTKRCTWDYLFKVPLTKDGEFTVDFETFEN